MLKQITKTLKYKKSPSKCDISLKFIFITIDLYACVYKLPMLAEAIF